MSPLLRRLIDTVNHLKAQGATHGQIAEIVRELVNSEILAAAVAATPTPIDDMILGALKLLFPPAAIPAAA